MNFRQHLSPEILFVLLLTLISACNNTSGVQKAADIVTEPEKMNEKVIQDIREILQKLLASEGKLNDTTKLVLPDVVHDFYASVDNKNLWSSKQEWLPLGDSLFNFIENARLYGLFPNDFHHKQLRSIRNRITADSLAAGDRKDALLWSNADLMLTDAFFAIASQLHIGRLGTDSTYMNPDSSLTKQFYHKNLQDVLNGKGLLETFHSLEPKHKGYMSIRENIRQFLNSANFSTNFTYVPYPFKDSLAFVKMLVKRLQEDGVISWQLKTVDSVTLAGAIIKAQQKRNLKADGKLGAQLIRSLNNTDAEKFKRIAINLDRYKVLPPKMPERYIWVNLPSYYLQVIENDTVKIESRVVVGKPNTRTPLLTSYLSDMVVYPQWTIPNSIIVKEILPALKRNPGYLRRRGYMLMRGSGDIVDPYSVNWAKYSKGIPYRIVQGSGDANALGVMKFNFPNKYAVYLHDTNQRYLFKNSSRALSHGCVRVQEWEKLTYYINSIDSIHFSGDTSLVASDSIRSWLQRKERHVIPIKSKIPVYFRYFTVEGKNGKIIFFDDIYNEDKAAREVWFSSK